MMTKVLFIQWAIPEKNIKQGGWGHGISRGIEEKNVEIPGSIKKEAEFRGVFK